MLLALHRAAAGHSRPVGHWDGFLPMEVSEVMSKPGLR